MSPTDLEVENARLRAELERERADKAAIMEMLRAHSLLVSELALPRAPSKAAERAKRYRVRKNERDASRDASVTSDVTNHAPSLPPVPPAPLPEPISPPPFIPPPSPGVVAQAREESPPPTKLHGPGMLKWSRKLRAMEREIEKRNDVVVVPESPPPTKLHGPRLVTPPDTPPENWTGDDFWLWFQGRRQAAGLLPERGPPRGVGAWWSQCRMLPGVTVAVMQEATYSFGEDEHWKAARPACPFAGFMSQWERFVPVGVVHVAS